MKPTDLSVHVTNFLTRYLAAQRNLSPNTIKAYRDVFTLVLRFGRDVRGIAVERLALADIDVTFVEAFRDHLGKDRHCSIRTQNQRLAVLHAFFRYVAPRDRAVLRCMQRHVAEEGMDRGEAHVATASAVLALALEVIEERSEQRRVQLRHAQIRRCLAQPLLGIPEEQAERVAVARDGVGARLTLLHEPVHDECLHQRRSCADGGHGRCPCLERSTRRSAYCSSFGVAVRYQYVSVT
jgi:hypothetical protein